MSKFSGYLIAAIAKINPGEPLLLIYQESAGEYVRSSFKIGHMIEPPRMESGSCILRSSGYYWVKGPYFGAEKWTKRRGAMVLEKEVLGLHQQNIKPDTKIPEGAHEWKMTAVRLTGGHDIYNLETMVNKVGLRSPFYRKEDTDLLRVMFG